MCIVDPITEGGWGGSMPCGECILQAIFLVENGFLKAIILVDHDVLQNVTHVRFVERVWKKRKKKSGGDVHKIL